MTVDQLTRQADIQAAGIVAQETRASTRPRAPSVDRIQCGDRQVWLDDGRIESPVGVHQLRPLEARLVRYLAQAGGQVVDRDELFRAVWGYRPGVRSRTLDTTVKTVRQKLERDPARPRHLVTCRGQGYRLDAETAEPDPLFGRGEDLAAISALRAARPGLLTLVGTAGVGKSRLAAHLAGRGAAVVALHLASTTGELVAAVGQTLLRDSHASSAAVAAALSCGALPVLVLDDADRLDARARAHLADWMARGPLLLATSRMPLRVRGEHVHRVRPLDAEPAAALFLDRVRRRVRQWPGTHDDATVAAVVRRLDGVPLALELAAALAPSLSPDGLLAALDHRLAVLTNGPADGPARHASLDHALDWSWQRLSPPHRAALAALSVFEGRFGLSEAAAVAATPPRVVLDLVEASLVSADDGELRLLHSVREWAAAHLDASTAGHEVRRRRAHTLAALCRTASFDPAAALGHRLPELESALDWSLEHADAEAAGPLAHAVLGSLYLSGSAAETARWLARVDAGAPLEPRWAVRCALWHLTAACGASDADRVLREAPALVDAARAQHDTEAERLLCALLGHAAMIAGDLDAAEAWYAGEMSASIQHPDPRAVARSTLNHAKMRGLRGDDDGRRRGLRQALHLLRAAEDSVHAARAAGMLAASEIQRGRAAVARTLLGPAIAAATADRVRLVGMLETVLGRALHALGDRPGAIAALERALRHAHTTGDRNVATAASTTLAELSDS